MRHREERLRLLFEQHADDIHAYACWRVGRQDAADVVAEVFLVAWRSLDRVRAGEERGWLFGVARTVLLAHRRQAAMSARLWSRLAGSGGTGVCGVASEMDERTGGDRLAEGVALRDQVRRALEVLRASDRELLVMAFWFGLSPAEAARALKIPRPVYAVRLHRARNRFRAAFQNEHPVRPRSEAAPVPA